MREQENYLGISLGIQRMGLAIGNRDELIDSQVKYFDKRPSEGKVPQICKIIERAIERYDVTSIAIKVPRMASRSKASHKAIDAITNLAKSKGIPLVKYDIFILESRFVKESYKNKKKLASGLLHTYPELKRYYSKIDSEKGIYYYKLFEAVAAMKLLSESIKNDADSL